MELLPIGINQLKHMYADAEIAAACLLAWVHREHAAETAELKLIFSDLVFEARCMGTGAKFMCQKLEIIKIEEAKRDVIGMSS